MPSPRSHTPCRRGCPMIFSDLQEVKSILQIDPGDKSEDRSLLMFLEQVSKFIEEWLNRPGLTKKARTEYYNGTGTQKLLLRSRPVFTDPEPQVWVDEAGFWGQASGSFATGTAQTFGTDFSLWIDQDDGTSRSGILVRNRSIWPRPAIRQAGFLSPFLGTGFGNVKVTYTAGYTVDTLPAEFRTACNLLVGRYRYVMPVGVFLAGESYEDRSIAISQGEKQYMLSVIKPLLWGFRNWKF